MGVLSKVVNSVTNWGPTQVNERVDPLFNAVTDTVQEAVNTGYGKPLGSDKSGMDVIGAGPLNKFGIGGDPNKPSDRRVGRLVGSIFAGYGIGTAANAGVDATAAGATSSGAGAGSATGGGAGFLSAVKDVAGILAAASSVSSALSARKAGQAPQTPVEIPAITLPTPESSISRGAQQNSLFEQLVRRGRASTILTNTQTLGA